MRIALERRPPRPGPVGTALLEVVAPRTNAAAITPAENLLGALSLEEPFSLEIAATGRRRRFLARAASPEGARHMAEQLGVAYPQAALRPAAEDPVVLGKDEQVAACTFTLRAPAYLPIRTFRDADVDAERTPQADPVLGLLGALGDLPDGWRSASQLVLRAAPDDWCRDYLRLAVEHPLASERGAARMGVDTSLTSVLWLAAALGAAAVGLQAYTWYEEGDWAPLALLVSGTLALGGSLAWLIGAVRRWRAKPMYDMRLVQEKVSRVAYHAELRLALIAPGSVARPTVEARLRGLAAAFRQYSLAAGNGLVPRPLDLAERDLRSLDPFGRRAVPILNVRELAGLWHLPQRSADVPLLERTTARRFLPLPDRLAAEGGCRVGSSGHQGRSVTVALPDALLRRHLLLVAKTRRGKSSLLLQLARHLMAAPSRARPAVVLVDPHGDLAWAALGLVPPARREDVVYLDLAERERPFGLNLLDTALGWDRDKAVANALVTFRREFDRYWGPRMEDAFRFALLTLYEANQAICAADPTGGRAHQHTVLEVPAVLANVAFRRTLLPLVTDTAIKAWWSEYFQALDPRLQMEIINPVATKVNRFAGSLAARAMIGQPASTVDPSAWIRDGAIVVVNGAKGEVGEGTAALLGGTLVNLVALAIGEQAALEPAARRPVTILADEFHSLPGADYESLLSELAKYGASLVLATQSLARLEALDPEGHRALRATVFANLDGLFAFHTSADDAAYLVPELGGQLDEQDLVELGDYQCYARVSAGGERLPTFSIQLDPPPASDAALAGELAEHSARVFGRDEASVDEDLRSALARIDAARTNATTAGTATGVPAQGSAVHAIPGAGHRPRNQYRNKGRRQVQTGPGLFQPEPVGGDARPNLTEEGAGERGEEPTA